MPNIKANAASAEPTVRAEQEFQFAKQQAEIKDSDALLQEFSRRITEKKERVKETHTETEQKQTKDTAEITELRRQLSANGSISADEALRWVLEQLGEDWEAFLEWQPDPELELTKQLQELSKLYLALLEAALKSAEGENLKAQLERLDTLLAQKLNLMMEQNLEQLTSLLEETGQPASLDSIRSSLYRQTAGRSISPQAAHTLFAIGRPAAGKSNAHPREGMIYQSSGKQNVRFQQTYHTQQNSWKEQIRQRNAIISNARRGIAENTFKQGSLASCSGRELERANRFAAHINGSGNLFKNPQITARNEEVTGLLAAVMSIKGQVYASESRGNPSTAFALENAIEKIIDQYLGRKGASGVYYHTLAAYKQTKNPQKAIQEGEDYAYRQFREKQGEPAYQKSSQYSRDAGLFRSLPKGLSPEKAFAMGIQILQKDWQTFLWAIGGRQASPHSSRVKAYSLWGLLADTGTHLTDSDGIIGKILLGTAGIIIISVLAILYFRLL